MPIPQSDSRIRLVKTSFVIYYHKDIQAARRFFLDFGMTIEHENPGSEIFFSGYGSEPIIYIARSTAGQSRFGGAAYEVETRRELERAVSLPGASTITALDAPGGGEMVTLMDPAGHPVHLVHGQAPKATRPVHLEKLTVNYEDEKPRKGAFQRFRPGPAPVHKWGHYGVTVSLVDTVIFHNTGRWLRGIQKASSRMGCSPAPPKSCPLTISPPSPTLTDQDKQYPPGKYQEMFDWYTKTLALAPSDIVVNKESGHPVTCFFHIDRGLEYTDHHAFFFKPAKPGEAVKVAHAAFEVHDFDIQQLGHQFLLERGYELCWGVGRHVLGSQVFDYWFDTSKFMVASPPPIVPSSSSSLRPPNPLFNCSPPPSLWNLEKLTASTQEHYADGDLVNSETPVATVEAGPQALSIWGPPVPEVF